MKSTRTRTCSLLVAMLAILAVFPVTSATAQVESPNPDLPATPLAAIELVEAVPFTLEKGERHYWRMERPMMTSGYMLVLKVNPNAVWPRQAAQPVLYVGTQTAERFNRGHLNGHVVVFVPGNVTDPKAEDYIDLSTTRIWFGDPELPERIDQADIEAEHARAEQAGIRPFTNVMINRARERGGADLLELADKNALIQRATDLVIRHAPDEVDFIRTHRPNYRGGA